ncbi:GAF domain-containing sensor histidine kinase [Spirulina subsalsa FACHB-351]|uniref:histidine kinase n=1 Tax=Spirulina subsalsa FACHB-351 TaxID=234711 RepID=A0ABT3L933_9CYAN|nr:GAF domain-containing sensor histidine kinase [Spirulina subsalsa]MCW6037967.1 GAF domain-containing sensor histidine kinase [Spirulina subsalsa FACHB-351]
MSLSGSREFVNLCQAQLALLAQSFDLVSCAVYLTEQWVEGINPKLVPVVVYPEGATAKPVPNPSRTPQKTQPQTPLSHPLLPPAGVFLSELAHPGPPQSTALTKSSIASPLSEEQQIVLPLLHNNEVLGVLVTRREEEGWSETELSQLEKVAQTLAIACFLDRQSRGVHEQLDQRLRSMGEQTDRLDDLLHQIRNPMTALRTFSKLLLKRFLPEDRNYKIAESIVRESDRLQDLLQGLEQYAEDLETQLTPTPKLLPAESSRPLSLLPGARLELAPVEILDILEPLLLSASAIAQEKNLQWFTHLPPHLPPILANGKALREVFSNLLDNALKYTLTGGVALEAGLTEITPQGTYQGVALHDTGLGIPPADQGQIFQRHYRGVQAQGSIPGTGLGLAIVKELLDQMQGKIEIMSPRQPNPNLGLLPPSPTQPGTSVILWLPLFNSAPFQHD